MNQQLPLAGLNILVVEDSYTIAMELCDQLSECGCHVVGPAPSVRQALDKIDGVTLHGAVLDINLGDERSFPIAELLASRGLPFLFLTGYDSPMVIPDAFAQAPRLLKPVNARALTKAVAEFRGA